MKCKEQEEKLTRQEVELKSTKRKASSTGANLAKISTRMHAAKEERIASETVNIRVTKDHKFDGAGLQKLDARSRACTYRAPKTSTRYTKQRAPKINSDVCLTKFL